MYNLLFCQFNFVFILVGLAVQACVSQNNINHF